MNWHYAVGEVRHGPFGKEEFGRLIATGVVTDVTLVWHEGRHQWQPFSELKADFEASPSLPPVEPPVAQPTPVAFVFKGNAGEYFKIWIVNLLLTIVTLGIYAAWAKVRNRRYFYANTQLLGHAFDYTGNPVRILIGNVIVLGMSVVYFTSGAISPFLVLGVVLVFMFLVPWLIVKSLSFNARNSAYRGLRFGFDGTYGGAAKVFVLFPILAAFTLYLLFPWVQREQKNFVVGQHRYGSTHFQFSGRAGELYKIFGLTLLFCIPLLICYGGMIGTVIAHGNVPKGAPAPPMLAVWGILFFPAVISAMIGSYFFKARLFNFVWGNTTLGRHCFQANMGFGGLLGLQIVNALVVTFTAGLMYPWAKVRTVEFTLKSLQLVTVGGIDDLTGAGPVADVSALGESAADFFDFDIGLGL